MHKRADNLLDREFNQTNSSTHWVGDITYIKIYQGWSYLASVLDLTSRQVVGWFLSKQPNTDQLMFHSDQGTQYASKAFIEYCNKNSITQSVIRKGNCWDNAVMGRFLGVSRLND